MWLLGCEVNWMICLAVLTRYRYETDKQTAGIVTYIALCFAYGGAVTFVLFYALYLTSARISLNNWGVRCRSVKFCTRIEI